MGFNLGIALGSAANTGLDTYLKLKKQQQEDYKFKQYQQQQDREDAARKNISALPTVGTKTYADATGAPVPGTDNAPQATADANADWQSQGAAPVAPGDNSQGWGPQTAIPQGQGATPHTITPTDHSNAVVGALNQAGDYQGALQAGEVGSKTALNQLQGQNAQMELTARQSAQQFHDDITNPRLPLQAKVQKYQSVLETAAATHNQPILIDAQGMTYQSIDPKTGKPVGTPQPITQATLDGAVPYAAMSFFSNDPTHLSAMVQAHNEAQRTGIQQQTADQEAPLRAAQAKEAGARADETTALTGPKAALTTNEGRLYGVRAAHEGDLMDAQAGYYDSRGDAALQRAQADESKARIAAAKLGQPLGLSKDGKSILYNGSDGITARPIPAGMELDHLFPRITGDHSGGSSPEARKAAYEEYQGVRTPKDQAAWHSKWDPILGGNAAPPGPPPELVAAFGGGPKPGAAPAQAIPAKPAPPAQPALKELPPQFRSTNRGQAIDPRYATMTAKLGPPPPEFIGSQAGKRRNPAYDKYIQQAQGLI